MLRFLADLKEKVHLKSCSKPKKSTSLQYFFIIALTKESPEQCSKKREPGFWSYRHLIDKLSTIVAQLLQ